MSIMTLSKKTIANIISFYHIRLKLLIELPEYNKVLIYLLHK